MDSSSTGLGVAKDATGPTGKDFVRWPGLILTLACCLAVAIALIYSLVQVWPPPVSPGDAAPPAPLPDVHILGWSLTLSLDGRLFFVVAVAGAIGGILHALQSLSWYAGNRTLRRSWVVLYSVMPVSGAIAGVIFYIVLRAGLLTASASTSDASPFGFAAVAALVGLFLAQALEKLQDVFSTLFTPAPKGDNYTPAAADASKVTGFSPERGSVGEEVVIIGTGLAAAHAVRFNGILAPPVSVTANRISVRVPEGATTGPVVVETPDVTITCPGQFNVTSAPGVAS